MTLLLEVVIEDWCVLIKWPLLLRIVIGRYGYKSSFGAKKMHYWWKRVSLIVTLDSIRISCDVFSPENNLIYINSLEHNVGQSSLNLFFQLNWGQ